MTEQEKIPRKVIEQQHEAYGHWCPVCGQSRKPYKTCTAWWSHLEKDHPKTHKALVVAITRSGDDDR